MMKYLTIALFLFQFVSLGSCLQEPVVSLIGGVGYLNLRDPVHRTLECVFTLSPDETVSEVSWEMNRDLVYTWSPEIKGKGLGALENKLILDRQDGNMEFASVALEIGGVYTCKVTSSLGETLASQEYQLVVVDVADGVYSDDVMVEDCQIKVSWSVPAILPKPTPRCGVWQKDHGYTGTTATSWQAVPYFNGSIAYHLDKEPFKIVEMSLNAVIKCEVGIMKGDKTFVVLEQHVFNASKVGERGCSILEVGDNIKLTYENEQLSCRHEVTPKDPSKNVMAIIRCPEGTVPSYRGDVLSEVKLYCSQARWELVQGYTWDDFDNFRCKDPSVVVAETINLNKKESKEIIPKSATPSSPEGTNHTPLLSSTPGLCLTSHAWQGLMLMMVFFYSILY